MTRKAQWWLLATGLFIGAAAWIVISDFEGRIDELEVEVDRLELELFVRPAVGDLIVVGKEVNQLGNAAEICVRYRAFGTVGESCIPAVGDTEIATQCFSDAQSGRPLPPSCR